MDSLKLLPASIVRLYSVAFELIDLSQLAKPANDNVVQYSLSLEHGNDNEPEN